MALIVKSEIKKQAKPLKVSSDFFLVLEEKVKKIIETACNRAKENSRTTVMKKDL